MFFAKRIKFITAFIVTVVLTLGLSISFQALLADWTAPTSDPPDDDVFKPITESSVPQQVGGLLMVNSTDAADNGFIVEYGDVGIGTNNPGEKLDVSGNIVFDDYLYGAFGTIARSTDEWLRLNDGNSHTSGIYTPGLLRADGGFQVDGEWVIGDSGRHHYAYYGGTYSRFGQANTSGFGIDATNNSNYDFLVYESSFYGPMLYLGYNGNARLTSYDSNEHLVIDASGSGNVILNDWVDVRYGIINSGSYSSGQVLISDDLRVNGRIQVPNNFSLSSFGDGRNYLSRSGAGQGLVLGSPGASPTLGYTLDTASYSIVDENDGTVTVNDELKVAKNVGIGRSPSGSPSTKLIISGGGINVHGSTYGLYGEGSSYGVSAIDSDTGARGYLGTGSYGVYSRGAGNVGLFSRDGDGSSWTRLNYNNYGVYTNSPVRATAFLYSSDYRLKKNIETITNALDDVQKLEGVRFEWKDKNKVGKNFGMIAQDVEKILPELVSTDDNGMKAIQYGNIVAVLIEAIKEQQKQLDYLEEEIERLKVNK